MMSAGGSSVHRPVMLRSALDFLRAAQGGDFLDCTLGGGGHSAAILEANPVNTVVAADRDPAAARRAAERLSSFAGRAQVISRCFSQLRAELAGRRFRGVLADLGLSSDQLAEGRGFSFQDRGPLDMRMDQSSSKTAHDIVNCTGPRDLYVMLKEGGVGREARAVSAALVKARPIETTERLAEVVRRAAAARSEKRVDPATCTFQAIRMAVNDELDELEALLDLVPQIVEHSGRLVIICFHSGEDRVTASRMRDWGGRDAAPALWRGPKTDRPSLGRMLTRKAALPSAEETAENPRARSARMRVFEFN